MRKKALNDNDVFTFSRIGLAADLILNKLRLQAQLDAEQKFGDAIGQIENRDSRADSEREDDAQAKRAIK